MKIMERLVQSEDPSLGGCHHAKKAFEEASPAGEGRFSPMDWNPAQKLQDFKRAPSIQVVRFCEQSGLKILHGKRNSRYP